MANVIGSGLGQWRSTFYCLLDLGDAVFLKQIFSLPLSRAKLIAITLGNVERNCSVRPK
jgi:hypothetical protein